MQMAMLEPKDVHLGMKADSGLDVDAMNWLLDGGTRCHRRARFLRDHHYQRLLDTSNPRRAHQWLDVGSSKTGGPRAGLEVETTGMPHPVRGGVNGRKHATQTNPTEALNRHVGSAQGGWSRCGTQRRTIRAATGTRFLPERSCDEVLGNNIPP